MTDTIATAGKLICCVLPDDGTHKRILIELRERFGIVRAGSTTCRGIGALHAVKAKQGKLPEAELVKQLYAVCSEEEADKVFDFIFRAARLDKPGRGSVWQQSVSGCTPYQLPANVADEYAAS